MVMTAPSETRSRETTSVAILDAAERLFRTFGYRKTTVADIARELGMSPANVYRFFPTKAAINEAICARLLSGLDNLLWSIARAPEPAPDRLRRLFETLQRMTLELFFQERRMHDMVEAAMEERWPAIMEHVRSLEGAFRHIVMDGVAAGLFAPCDPEQTAKLINDTTLIFTHPNVIAQCAGEVDVSDAAKTMAEFVLKALRGN